MHANENEIRCHRCHREVGADDLDRILWCEECVDAERKRAGWWGRGIAAGAVLLLVGWILWAIQPGPDFRILWLLVLAVAYGLIARLGKELVFGVRRVRNRPGARADANAAAEPARERP